jgi:hypothetical protein
MGVRKAEYCDLYWFVLSEDSLLGKKYKFHLAAQPFLAVH